VSYYNCYNVLSGEMGNPREEVGLRGRAVPRPVGTCITDALIFAENIFGTN
jgi:hypothetical protein